jgi:hypothetical protein
MCYSGQRKIFQTITKKLTKIEITRCQFVHESPDTESCLKLSLVHIGHMLPRKCSKTRYWRKDRGKNRRDSNTRKKT